MNWKTISRNVGVALLVSALFMFISALVSLTNDRDSAMSPLLVSGMITFFVGIFPCIFVGRTPRITLKEGYVIIVLSWMLSFVFGMLPYTLWGGPFSIENAWFESVSGFTTTGATILSNIESLPAGLLFWRSSTHFIGGLGVVVFLLLIIPSSSPLKLRLTNMEISSLSKGNYSTRANQTVYIFAYVYLGIGIIAFLVYLLCGMSVFDAANHAMSVCSTGGFSTKNLSIAGFNSPLIEAVTLVFMLVASLHFGLLYLSVISGSVKPLKQPVTRFYLMALLLCSVGTGLALKFTGRGMEFGKAMWYGAFQTVSTASTTGFAIADNSHWPMLPNLLLLCIAVMCGCAGSTTGGIKADRVLVLLEAVKVQIRRFLHPSSVCEVKLGNRFLRDDEVSSQMLYIALYALILMVSALGVILLGMRSDGGFAAALCSIGNVGPSIGDLGTFGNYSSIPETAKFVLTLDMFLGRVEIYPVISVLAMIFNRSSRK